MSSLNKVFLIGRVGRDPEIRATTTGKKVANFSLATGQGENTEWHKIIAWEKTCEYVEKFITKGRLIHIEGSIQSREYESKGEKKNSFEIVCRSVTILDQLKEECDVPF